MASRVPGSKHKLTKLNPFKVFFFVVVLVELLTQVNQDGSGNVFVARGLVVVNVEALLLNIGLALVDAFGIKAVFLRDSLPELSTDLVTALAGLDVNDFSHICFF